MEQYEPKLNPQIDDEQDALAKKEAEIRESLEESEATQELFADEELPELPEGAGVQITPDNRKAVAELMDAIVNGAGIDDDLPAAEDVVPHCSREDIADLFESIAVCLRMVLLYRHGVMITDK